MNGNGSQISIEALRSRILSVPTLIALLVGAGLLAFVLWRVFDFDWNELWTNIKGIDIWLYLSAAVIYYISFWFRGLRWRLIAITANTDGQDGKTIPGPTKMGGIILMGWFANSVAFLRLGDALRGWTLHRESTSPFASSLGTVLAERVQDMVAVLALIFVAAIVVTVNGHAEVPGEVVVAAIVLVAVLIIGLIGMRVFGMRASRFLPRRIQGSYGRFQEGTLRSFRGRQLPHSWPLESLVGCWRSAGSTSFLRRSTWMLGSASSCSPRWLMRCLQRSPHRVDSGSSKAD